MKLLKLSFVIVGVMLLTACSSKKTTASATNTSNSMSMEAQKMTENGFTMGTVIASKKEGECPFMIMVGEGKDAYYYDPINLDDFASLKNDGEKVWFTYTGLRRMNRCPKANPVNIVEMKKRGQ